MTLENKSFIKTFLTGEEELKKLCKCGYCQDGLIVPNKIVPYLCNKIINLSVKKSNPKYILQLQSLCRMSPIINHYVKNKYPKLYNELVIIKNSFDFIPKIYLKNISGTDRITLICCDICHYDTCEFHLNYGGFVFEKCPRCNAMYNICGWCVQKQMLLVCEHNNKNASNDNISIGQDKIINDVN